MKKVFVYLALTMLMGLAAGTASAQLPVVTLKTMDGQTVSTDTLNNNGKPFIIDFFARYF